MSRSPTAMRTRSSACATIADLLLIHDRPIQTRTDDSVLRVVNGPGGPRRMLLRRSRGYVPGGLPLADHSERRSSPAARS